MLGGSSSINAMIHARGHPSDYDAWAAGGNAGWVRAEVLPHFKRTEHNKRGADAWHGSGGTLNVRDRAEPNPFAMDFVEAGVQAGHRRNPDVNGAKQEGVGLYQVTQHGGQRCSAARVYLLPARDRPQPAC